MVSYTYDPTNTVEPGKDRMRLELGDTTVEGGADTAALSDQEIAAALARYPQRWTRAKFVLVESVWRRYAHEVNTSVGSLTLALGARADTWKAMYDELKRSAGALSGNIASSGNGTGAQAPYFYEGMLGNAESGVKRLR